MTSPSGSLVTEAARQIGRIEKGGCSAGRRPTDLVYVAMATLFVQPATSVCCRPHGLGVGPARVWRTRLTGLCASGGPLVSHWHHGDACSPPPWSSPTSFCQQMLAVGIRESFDSMHRACAGESNLHRSNALRGGEDSETSGRRREEAFIPLVVNLCVVAVPFPGPRRRKWPSGLNLGSPPDCLAIVSNMRGHGMPSKKTRSILVHRRWSELARAPRTLGLSALLGFSALALSSCGASTPSAAQTVAQDIASGVAAQNSGDYAKAATYYHRAVVLQPGNAFALFDLGDAEQFQHLDASAKQHYLAALAIDPRLEAAMFNLAVLVAPTNPAEAAALYKQVLVLSPKDADAHFNLGYALIAMHQTTAGNAQIALAIRLDPSLKSRVKSK